MDNRRRMMWKKPPEYAIYYTSTDGNIVTPYTTSGWGANIVSNTYENGVGKILFNKEVTAIPDNAFSGKTTINSIELPDSVTYIGYKAFAQCNSIEINIPVNVTDIKSQVFYKTSGKVWLNCNINNRGNSSNDWPFYMSDFSEIIIGDNVTYIGDFALKSYTNTTRTIVLGTSLKYIDLDNTYDSITRIIIQNMESYYNIEGIKYYLNPTRYEVYFNNAVITEIEIPSNITKVPSYAFLPFTNVSSIKLHDCIQTIGDYAFAYCTSLTSITIPDSVTSIGQYAFYYCTSLTSVTIGNGVTSIGAGAFNSTISSIYISDLTAWCTLDAPLYFPSGNFDLYLNGELITDLTIPPGVTSIRSGAFYYCQNITSVTIPDSVVFIGANAFNSSKISTVNIQSIESWCNIVFASQGSNPAIGKNLSMGGEIINNIIIPSTVTKLNEYAFEDVKCDSIVIPNSVVEINCTPKTANVYVADLSTWLNCKFSKGFLGTATKLYVNNEFLDKLTIPDDVSNIGSYTFYNYYGLNELVIPNHVTSIGDYAFYNCYNLRSISCWSDIDIHDSAFRNVTRLEYIYGTYASSDNRCWIKDGVLQKVAIYNLANYTIPNEVSIIDSYSIEKYYGNILYLPHTIVEIRPYAISSCSRLSDIFCYSIDAPKIYQYSLQNLKANGILHISDASDYSTWLTNTYGYLGYQKWTFDYFIIMQTYYNLYISANDVDGGSTTTIISWTCMCDGIDTTTGETITGIQLSGTATSEEFPQNTSETETVERTITFEYQGLTASTTITQGVWINQSYELVLNDNWQLSTAVANPDSALYDGVYESFSNYNKNSTAAIMYIDISGYETFKLYIRSYAESNYDYVMVSQIDQTIDNNSSYSNTTLVKAHTRGTQKSGTTISDYTLVEFTGLDRGEHRITVVYRKDSSGNSGTDKGYLIIPRQ